jgi:hypothetical protein
VTFLLAKKYSMKRKFIALMLFAMIAGGTGSLHAQIKANGALLSNNVTSFPVTGYPQVFYSQFHPGIDLFKGWKINKKEKNQFWFMADLGGYYHRFVQTALRLYATVNYQNIINPRLNLFVGLGGGYLHSIETEATLKLNDQGVYETNNKITGRPQMLIAVDLGGSFALKKDDVRSLRIQIDLRTYVQGVFVKGYVPFLPLNTFAIGITKPIYVKRKTVAS